jgi:hypothetical protein
MQHARQRRHALRTASDEDGYELWCARCMRTALDEAESIVRDLAKEERIRNEGHGYLLCEHCHAYVERGDPKTHDESCLQRRAIEYSKAT